MLNASYHPFVLDVSEGSSDFRVFPNDAQANASGYNTFKRRLAEDYLRVVTPAADDARQLGKAAISVGEALQHFSPAVGEALMSDDVTIVDTAA
jgi:hypothetical protein